jgi:hypothetical protein
MDQATAELLARATLYLHFGVIVFNIGALILIPLGKIFGWPFVHVFWWRAAHIASMVVVAIQPALGQYCFLTTIENYLRYESGFYLPPSASDEWIRAAVFWPLPPYAFLPLYLLAAGLTVWFWIWVRPVSGKHAIGEK